MLYFVATNSFKNDVNTAIAFIRASAGSYFKHPDVAEEEFLNELEDVITALQHNPFRKQGINSSPVLRRAIFFHDLYAVEYAIRPTTATTVQYARDFVLLSLIPILSGRSQQVSAPDIVFDFD
jgi:hypothetical protein